ncbi:MAG TPA: hypothetical protein VK139_03845 [Microbacteriaceae bacterium]|nr:hypothetical protein [Microbacteriaceae bacterium]
MVRFVSVDRALGHIVRLSLAFVLGVCAPVLASASAAMAAGSTAAGTDNDGDTIPDAVELVVCGTITCATGREDADRDGVADWMEVLACGSTGCAHPNVDSDQDGVPDFAETIACGSASCVTDDRDSDGDSVPDWVEVVICGTLQCATGHEDLDANGVTDASELLAHAVYIRQLAQTGIPWPLIALILAAVAITLGLIIATTRVVRSRR